MARQETANTIINRVALEVGLIPVSDPVGDTDPAFIQLAGLLTATGQELVELRPWQVLRQEFQFTTDSATNPTGVYDLPDDFSYMINQTGWDQTNNRPLGGPLSAQSWSYIEGEGLASSTIYANFRIAENSLTLWPEPPANNIVIRFEYISRYWITQVGQPAPNADSITAGTDLVLYEPILVVKLLKCKFLEAKGFDSQAARLEFETIFDGRSGRDEGGRILSAGNGYRNYPYLTPYRNIGDTGYGA